MVKVTSLLVKSESAHEKWLLTNMLDSIQPTCLTDSANGWELAGCHLANRLRVAECHLAHVILGQVFGRVRLILLVLLFVYELRSVNIHTYGERSLIVGPIAKLSGQMDDINYTATLKFLLMSLLWTIAVFPFRFPMYVYLHGDKYRGYTQLLTFTYTKNKS